MSLESATRTIYRALSITPTQVENPAPVLYELTGDLTDIGAAEDNAIVLSDPSVARRHLAVRRSGGRDHLVVDLAERWRDHDLTWHAFRAGDAYWCPRHGSFEQLDQRKWCPRCKRKTGSLWLMRLLYPGDTFNIGSAFQATYVVQEQLAPPPQTDVEIQNTFPTAEVFETHAPAAPSVSISANEPPVPSRALPTDDSNLWRWQPEGVPFPIFMHQRVNLAITQHARQNNDREVGGVLLGEVCQDANERMYVVITHALKAEFADETRGHLTFTQKTWLNIHHARETRYPDKSIVGWYHTHPGWTIFLSQWDLFIHQNFFRQPWQIALVIDPSLDRAGFFVWQGNEVNNPHEPVEPFRLAELDGWTSLSRPRVRIKLTDVNVNTAPKILTALPARKGI